MNKRSTEAFKNPLQHVRPLTVDPKRRFERSAAQKIPDDGQRPKTSAPESSKNTALGFYSNSTSTKFSSQSDEDYETDLEDDGPQNRDHSCIGIYQHVCRREKTVPVGQYLRHYRDKEVSMRFYGLGRKGMQSFIPSLTMNQYITKLDLASNGLGDEGALYLSHILRDNTVMVDIDLSQNFIGVDGVRELCDMFRDNITINHLSLEGNLLDDESARLCSELISSTGRLYTLNLARNKFQSASGTYLGPALAENTTMRSLDLSWNGINGKGAVALIKGIQKNVFLQILNLDHNGLSGGECGRALFDALKENTTLLELDLGYNRLTTEPATYIGRGLAKNESLQRIRLTGNPIESAGCYAILKPMMAKNVAPNKLERIDLSEILVNGDFLELYAQLTQRRPDLRILIGSRPTIPLVKESHRPSVPPMTRLKTLFERQSQFDYKSFFLLAADGDLASDGRITSPDKLRHAIVEKLNVHFTNDDLDKLLEGLSQCDYKQFIQTFTIKPATTAVAPSWRYKP